MKVLANYKKKKKKKDSTVLDWLKECRRKKAEEIERLEKEEKKDEPG